MPTRYFTASEVEDLVFEGEVTSKIIGTGRWAVDTETIALADDGKHYRVKWAAAATEMQDHEFWGQEAVEVEKVTKTIEVTDWFPVEDE